MPRKALPPTYNDQDLKILKEWAGSRSMEARLVERAKMMCKLLDGESVSKVAIDLKGSPEHNYRLAKPLFCSRNCRIIRPATFR